MKALIFLVALTGCSALTERDRSRLYLDGVSDGVYLGCVHVFYNHNMGHLDWHTFGKEIDFERSKNYCENQAEVWK